MQFQSLNDVFAEQIGDLYDAENQPVKALPKAAGAASDEKLRAALEEHSSRPGPCNTPGVHPSDGERRGTEGALQRVWRVLLRKGKRSPRPSGTR